jgi:predicted MFS family arabinose efflux permease
MLDSEEKAAEAGVILESHEKADDAAESRNNHHVPEENPELNDDAQAPPADTHQAVGITEHYKPILVGSDGSNSATAAPGDGGTNADAEAPDVEDESKYPKGVQLILLTTGLCLTTLVVALDNTIIATAIPKITSQFNSLLDVGWYGSSYLLTTTALQPSFGKIYTHFNVKWTYVIATVIFEIGSIICAAAQNSVMLIVGRAVAGAGAAALFSGGLTIVGFSVPLRSRPIYIAALSSMFGIASVVGPLLGGVLTDRATWRWCVWINLPIGGIAIAFVSLFFHPAPRQASNMSVKKRILEIDLLGAAFLMSAIVCLLLALQWGGSTYPWKDSRVWGCLLGFGLLLIVFIAQQLRRGDRATIPPRILRNRTVLSSCLFSMFLSMGLYVHIFYLPFYFQAIKGTTAEGSGIHTIPYLISLTVSSIIVGGAITVLGYFKPWMIGGAAVFGVGAGLLYTLAIDTSDPKWIGYEILAGFGAGGAIQVPFISVQVALSKPDMPTGNAMAIFFNSLGGALSISIAQNIFQNGLYSNIPIYAPAVSVMEVIAAGSTNLRSAISPADLPGVLQAYLLSIDQAFILPIAMAGLAVLASLFVKNLSVKGQSLIPGGA